MVKAVWLHHNYDMWLEAPLKNNNLKSFELNMHAFMSFMSFVMTDDGSMPLITKIPFYRVTD